jgi:ATP-dependent Clp protease ATP-binding subunit ClpB
MTANIGSDIIQQFSDDSQYQQMKTEVMNEVSHHFKPEFINRIDESVVFHPLLAEQIQQIAGIQIQALAKRLAEQDLKLSVSSEALQLIAQVGFDPIFGARPLKRAIQKGLENPLAQKLLANEFTAGSIINIVAENGTLVIS